MVREQGHGPHRRAVAESQRVATDFPEKACSSYRRGGSGTPTTRHVLEGDNLTSGKIAGDPVVDRLQTDTSNKRNLWDGPPLGDPQDALYSLKHAFIDRTFQRSRESLLVVPIEAKLGRTLCSSHAASLPPMRYFSKNFC